MIVIKSWHIVECYIIYSIIVAMVVVFGGHLLVGWISGWPSTSIVSGYYCAVYRSSTPIYTHTNLYDKRSPDSCAATTTPFPGTHHPRPPRLYFEFVYLNAEKDSILITKLCCVVVVVGFLVVVARLRRRAVDTLEQPFLVVKQPVHVTFELRGRRSPDESQLVVV